MIKQTYKEELTNTENDQYVSDKSKLQNQNVYNTPNYLSTAHY